MRSGWLSKRSPSSSVALKLIKAGLNTGKSWHASTPSARLWPSWTTPPSPRCSTATKRQRGAPYFVMEYVAGVRITDYCDNHRLSTRERLELFMQVCEGVQHAHQKAIIHRDLKPSNILVTEVDGHARAQNY